VRNVSEKKFKRKTNILCSKIFFFENLTFYEMWKSTLEPDGPQRQYGAQKHVICMLDN